ncbi:MAG TPA: YebC/PmpR family DNA-binding transcriptional regulator [Gemmataceae bacterium]|jgi:YebC/PmpR family DNA-binding regulatory protein|nr:YebC/PmpR family DNA-binding transcriptional regulator [Gemmataceae bacterium]
MSGHSHWATIKHKKGAIDAKRGKLFSKLSRAIIIAARHGGGDPEMNLKLRYAIDKARSVSMPKDNIERAVKRGTGEMEGATFEEIVYEGYGSGSVAIMVEVLTDNRNRTASEIRKIFERSGGKMGSAGCVGYMFERKGIFSIDAAATDEDTLMGIALDAGADDLKRSGSTFDITCDPSVFNQVQEALKKNGLTPQTAEISHLAKAPVDVDAETGKKVMRLMEALDDHDDVQNVYSSVNITEELVAHVGKD